MGEAENKRSECCLKGLSIRRGTSDRHPSLPSGSEEQAVGSQCLLVSHLHIEFVGFFYKGNKVGLNVDNTCILAGIKTCVNGRWCILC